MRVRTQLQLTVVLALAVAVVVGVLSWRSSVAAQEAEIEQEHSRDAARHAAALLLLTQEYPRYFEARVATQWQERHRDLTAVLGGAVPASTTEAAHRALRDSVARLPALFAKLTEIPSAPDTAFSARRADFLVDQMILETQSLADGIYRWSRDAAEAQQAATRRFRWISVASLVLVFVLLFGQVVVVARRLVSPLARIEQAAAAVEAGDLEARVGLESRDELGRLSRGFDQMTASLAQRRSELHAEIERREATERRLTDVTNGIPALVGHFDLTERLLFANEPAIRSLRLDRSRLHEYTMRSALGDVLYAQHEPALARVRAGERSSVEAEAELRGVRQNFQAHLVPELDAAGQVCGFYAMTFDITPLKQAEQARAAGEHRLRTITDNLPVLISYIDADGVMRFCNATYRHWLGVDPSRLVGRHLRDAIGPVLYAERQEHLERALRGEQVTFEIENTVRGTTRYLKTEYIPDRQPDGRVAGVYALSADISALKAAEARMSELARSDALTGLPNRRQLDERLAEAIARSRRSSRPLALMFLDIDHFKSINDSLGHQGGDTVLKEFADRLRACVRVTDTVARLAGDEFVVLLEGLNVGVEAEGVARKIISSMTTPVMVGAMPLNVTTSIGVVVSAAGQDDAASLMFRADEALYRAKRAGRNTFEVSTL
ncbi:diguanylate cyclase domain-containing protein [Rhizobacter sp. LjRoot28]|uniref:diguanylate cyclase domain-containing protein n=1 Tax=Rhizobacter sp. LjRoot28 TaxID=3342309 RepID=UPI003ECC972A